MSAVIGEEGSIAPVAGSTHDGVRRRIRRAQALGILGIVMTLGVAGLAFGPRFLEQARRAGYLHEEPARVQESAAEAPPAPTTEATTEAAIPVATELATTKPPPSEPTPPAPLLTVNPPEPTPPAPVLALTPPPPATASATPPAPATASAERRAASPPRHVERPLTANEIEARKERYDRWLREEGLKRLE